MPKVNIPGKGVVNFPDTMTPEQIQGVIENEIMPAAAPPAPAHLQPIPQVGADGTPMPPLYDDAPSSPPPVRNDTLANLAVSAQGAARGLGDLVGAPVDLTTGAMNATSWLAERAVNAIPGVDGVDLPSIDRVPIGGSQNIADLGSMAAEAVGVPLVDPTTLPLDDKLAYSINRFGTNALAAGGALRGPAIARANNPYRKPEMGDALLKPYESGAVKPHVGDVAAGAGSGTAVELGHEYLPEQFQGPMSDFVLSLLGGVGGAAATAPLRLPASLAETIVDAMPDPNAPMLQTSPATSYTNAGYAPVSRGATKRAAEYYQGNATDPNLARETIRTKAQGFRDEGLPVPTTGTLSGDIGLNAIEQGDRVRNPVPYQVADQKVRTAATEQVRSVAPDNAEPRAATEMVGREAAQRRADAKATIADAEQTNLAATAAEQSTAAPYRAPPDKGAASRTLDEVVVDETMKPRQKAKNEKFGDVPDAPRPAAPFKAAAAEVRQSMGALNDPERVLPKGTLDRIDALGDTVNFQDLNKLRPELADAAREARRQGNYTLADNINALKKEIGAEAERMAAEGSPEASEALRFFKDDFAPYFGDGTVGGKLKDAINKDTDRVSTPPSATADRFLNVALGAKEAAADLKRILGIAPDPVKGQAAVRNYVLSDMAKVVDKNGAIDPRRMRDWYTKRKDMLSEFPELDAEMRKLLSDAVNSRVKSNATAAEVKKAVNAAKLTEDDIKHGNLSLLLDSSPDVAVRRVFGSNDPEKAMAEIATTLSKDKAAAEGWKKAVSQYMEKTLSGTNTSLTDTGDAPVQFAAMKKFFDQNRGVLAKVYSPKEMNALQRAQKLMAPFGNLSRRATVGSPTAENVSLANDKLRALEVALKAYYGVLEGGGRFRTLKLAMAALPNSDEQVGFLINRVQFDPDLALHLLDVPLKQQGTPAWNSKLNRLLGYQEASRNQE